MIKGGWNAPRKPPAVVRLTRLALTNFRSYSTARLEPVKTHVVFTGRNGVGKTNILEAISMLSPGRGLRRATYAEMGLVGGEERWAVAARVDKDGEEVAVGTGFEVFGTSRAVKIRGAEARPDDLSSVLRVIWLTPAMDGLFAGSASDRRRFIDRLALALFPSHGARSNAYERAMRQRNRMFEDGVSDPTWYDSIERQMAEHGAAIATARIELMVKLNAAQATRAAAGGDFPQAVLALKNDEGDADAAAFARRLRDRRARDRAAGRALSGPHLVDLTVLHMEKDLPAALSSTGEQKALLIGMILGHAALVTRITNETPLVLLDEVAAHLDAGRRAALYDTLDALGCQTFMTGTDDSLFEALGDRADRFHVAAGSLARAPG